MTLMKSESDRAIAEVAKMVSVIRANREFESRDALALCDAWDALRGTIARSCELPTIWSGYALSKPQPHDTDCEAIVKDMIRTTSRTMDSLLNVVPITNYAGR